MPRQKKEHFEYVPRLKSYRKRIKDADGKWVSVYGKTEEVLLQKLEEARAIIAVGQQVRRDPTVEQYAETWLPAVTAEMGAKYKESFEGAIRLHVLPVIGHLHLRDVRPDDTQSVMTKLAGKSSSLQGKVLNAMRRMFENAVKNGQISRNPCGDLKASGKKPAKKRPLTAAQAQTLLEAVSGTRADTFVHLGLYAGLRREESLGLKWEHVYLDVPVPYLEVCQAVTFPTNAKPVVSEILKSDAAARIIPLCPELLEHLKAQQQKTGFLIGGQKPLSYSQFANLWAIIERRQTGEGFYWDKVDGKMTKVKFLREKGAKSRGGDFCYTIDFPVTSHLLRHTCATNWIKSGVDPKTVQYLMGHADPDITLGIYAHVVEKSPEALADSIQNPLGLKSQKTVKFEVKTEQ